MSALSALSEINVYVEDDLVSLYVTYTLPRWRAGERDPFTAICPSCKLVEKAVLGLLERGCWEVLLSGLLTLHLASRLGVNPRSILVYVSSCYRILSHLYHNQHYTIPLLVEHVRRGVRAAITLYNVLRRAIDKLSEATSCGRYDARFYTIVDEDKAMLSNALVNLKDSLEAHKLLVKRGSFFAARHPLAYKRLPRQAEYGLIVYDGPVETGPAARVAALMQRFDSECVHACGARMCFTRLAVDVELVGVAHKAHVTIQLEPSDYANNPLASRLQALFLDAVYSLLLACKDIASKKRSERSTRHPWVSEALHGPRIVWGLVRNEHVYTLPSMYNVYSTFHEAGYNPPYSSMVRSICADEPGFYADLLLVALGLLTHCGKAKIVVRRGSRVLTRTLEPPRVQLGGTF